MKRLLFSVVVSGLAVALPMLVSAEEGQDVQRQQQTKESLNEIVSDRPPVTEELSQLQQLQRENPQAFRQSIEERKARLRERMAHLKARDPKAYADVQREIQQRRQQRLERLRERHPDRFRELMAQRQAQSKAQLERLKQQHPEQYEDLLERRHAWRQRQVEELKQHPETLERFQANHPDWVQPHEPRGHRQRDTRSERAPARGMRNGGRRSGGGHGAP